MRTVSIVNQSSLVQHADLVAACAALQIQVSRDFAPAWGLACQVVPVEGDVPAGETITLMDDATQADALGYHTIDQADAPHGYVFVRPTIDAGDYWQATLSHELLEQLADPWVCLTATAPWAGRNAALAWEACDPVENAEYAINGVQVSNFVLPMWFLPGSPGPWDFMRTLTGPLQMSAGGYQAYSTDLANWQQSFARETPLHQRAIVPYSRRHRRTVPAAQRRLAA